MKIYSKIDLKLLLENSTMYIYIYIYMCVCLCKLNYFDVQYNIRFKKHLPEDGQNS